MDRRSALKKTGWLAGTTVAMPTILSFLSSCKNEVRSTWQPKFFTDEEAMTISALVDRILPRTDTPGALDVKVDIFLDIFIARCYEKEAQDNIRNEIAAFNKDCESKYGDVLFNLRESTKIEVLQDAEKTSGKFNPEVWGKAIGEQGSVGFYRSLKSLAIWAYFTSEEIGKNVLGYDPVPGNYEPCINIAEIGKRWSL
jgi:hypothetical protein